MAPPSSDRRTDSPAPDPRHAGKRPPYDEPLQAAPGHEHRMHEAPDYGEADYRGHGRLAGRVAVITGADSGIGRAVALAYAREGADVIISYLDEHTDARTTAAAVEAAGRQAICVGGDIGDEATCAEIVDAAVQRFGRIDILVNNAAEQGKAVDSIEALDLARVERTFRTNIVAMFTLTRLALPHMRAGASIINVASIQAYSPSPPILDYASTKGAIVAFTKGLSQDLLPKRGIRVNAVAPGPVWTPLIAQSFPEQTVGHFSEGKNMGRPAQPKELAPSFVFLACDEGQYINGAILGVTGGSLLN